MATSDPADAVPRNAGFTLIEMMVTLVLFSLVILVLANGLQFPTKVWGARENARSDVLDVALVQQFLGDLLREVRPVRVKDDADAPDGVFFVGFENSMRFVAPMPGHLGVGGFYEVAIYLAAGDEQSTQPGEKLMMSWRLFRQSGASWTTGIERQTVLLSGVARVQFAYYGFHIKKPKAWYDDWEGLWFLPDLIRIRVTLTKSDLACPDLVVAPVVNSIAVKKIAKSGVPDID